MRAAKPTTITLAFRNQSFGLFVFGVLQIVMGCFCGFTAVALYAGYVPVEGAYGAINHPSVVFYCLSAILLMWLGAGSIFARRWAWTLTVILAWLWLMMGVGMVTIQAAFASAIPRWVLMITCKMGWEDILAIQSSHFFATVGLYVFLPLAFLMFYQRPTVRATCHWRDSRIPWTDRRPMPIVATSIVLVSTVMWSGGWLAYCCIAALFPSRHYTMWSAIPTWDALRATHHFVVSLGGMVNTTIGSVLWLLVLVLSVCLAIGVYWLKKAAWWGTFLLWAASTVVATWVFSHLNMVQWGAMLLLPPHERPFAGRHQFLGPSPTTLTCLASLAGGVMLTWLFFVRRYFVCSKMPDSPDSLSIGDVSGRP
jgi:hypothetical protein